MAASKLPYKMLGGIVPCPGGWLIVPARLAGVTVVAEDPEVVKTLLDVVEFKPKLRRGGDLRTDRAQRRAGRAVPPVRPEARDFIGWPRQLAVRPTPSRAALRAPTREAALELEPWLTRDDFRRFKWLREADEQFQPFHQRMFYAAHPDLTFVQLNNDHAAAVLALPAGRRASSAWR
jgi:hypothetical protein